MGARTVLSRVTPSWGKAQHQSWRERRLRRRAARVGGRYRERYEPTVRHGPFAGMRYPDDLVQLPKLLGTYEMELHAAVERLIAGNPQSIVNVGAGEGYYAVGLALRLPEARVMAFDIDEREQRRCRALAELNGVADRVTVGAECTLATLHTMPDDGVALVMDCEGCELALLRPDEVAPLRSWPILVELHDFIDPATSAAVAERFAGSHAVEVIEVRSRQSLAVEELDFLSPGERELALDEVRPPGMRWAELRPRAGTA